MNTSSVTRSSDGQPTPTLDVLLTEQNDRWDAGERVAAEDIVRAYPVLAGDTTKLVPLIVNEWMLRWDAGERPDLSDYQARFPQIACELALQFRAQAEFASISPTNSYTQATKDCDPATQPAFTPTLGGYRLIGQVGSGGMGVVYRAEQLSLGRTVAVKFLLAGRAARDGQIDRFLNEGRMLARLDHPNVVRVIEVGTADRSAYIVMEYVNGRTLAQHSGGRPHSLGEAIRWVELLARAVAYCHEQGVLHRDLKPANVLLTHDGVPKLTDFGLAKSLDPDGPSQLTRSGDVMGTPSYMAPEQAAGRPADRSTDVYGLGAILFELITGRPPFEGDSTLAVMKQVLEVPARSPRRLRPEVSRDLETVCLKCLEKEPFRRYQTADALADDLRRMQVGDSISARPISPVERGWRWCRRNQRVAVATSVVFFILIVATAVSLGFAGEAGRQAKRAQGNATVAQQERDAAFVARWRGMLNEVVGLRHGQRPGQRTAALAKLAEALTIARQGGPLDAEDYDRFTAEATSAYGLTDLIAGDEWEGWSPGTRAIRFSPDLTRYARLSEKPVELRSTPEGVLVHGFKSLNTDTVVLPTGTDHFFTIRPDQNAPGYSTLRRVEPNAEKRWVTRWERNGVEEICIRADGKLVAFNRRMDGKMILINGETNEGLHEFEPNIIALGNGAFHPTKPWVLCRREDRNNDGLAVVDTSTGKVIIEKRVDFFAGRAAWHPDGRRFAVAGDSRIVRVFDDRLNEQYTLPFRQNGGGDVQPAFSPSGEYLVTRDDRMELRVCDGTSGRLLLQEAMPLSDELRISTSNMLTPEQSGTALRQHRLTERSVQSLALAPLPDEPFDVIVWNPDRTLFVANHGTNNLVSMLHDGHTGKELAELPHNHIPLWFEPSGKAFVTVIDKEPGGKTDLLYRWPMNHTARTIGPPEPIRQQPRFGMPGASADRSVVAFANVVYKKGLGQPPAILDLSKHRGHDIRSTTVSPDGRWAVLGSHNQGSVCLYDLQAFAWKAELWPAAGRAVFSPDGTTLAVFGAVSGRLYRVSDWQVIRELPGSQGVFTPDSTLLAVSGASRGVPVGTIELIESATGRTVSRFEHPTRSSVDPVGFGPDPAKLYLRVQDTRTLDVWDLRDVRRRLKADLDLSWNWPEFPPPPQKPPADPPTWVVRVPSDWNRWLPKVDRLDWNRVLPKLPTTSLPKDR